MLNLLLKKDMKPEQLAMIEQEIETNKKNILVGYLLLLFGFHRFYYRKIGSGILYLFTGGGFVIWFLIDLLILPSIHRTYMQNLELEVVQRVKLMTS
jgi:TM2 domain-containing membrane protein YozV